MYLDVECQMETLLDTNRDLDERFSHLATKQDFERMYRNLRNWVIALGVSTTVLKLVMQYVMFQLYMR